MSIYYLIILFFGIQAFRLLLKNELIEGALCVNLSDPSYDSGAESAPFVATFPDPLAALGGIQDGSGSDATNQIVQSGGNSDGEWVKFAGGKMICGTGKVQSILDSRSAFVWTFPQPFSDDNYSTSFSEERYVPGIGSDRVGEEHDERTALSTSFRWQNASSGSNFRFSAMAMGNY